MALHGWDDQAASASGLSIFPKFFLFLSKLSVTNTIAIVGVLESGETQVNSASV